MGLFGRKKDFPSSVDYIIAGLGNPDRQYEGTRHNAGFMAIDFISEKLGCQLKQLKFKSYCTTTSISDKKVLLIKPQTYMNNSGQAIVEAMNFYKLPPENHSFFS